MCFTCNVYFVVNPCDPVFNPCGHGMECSGTLGGGPESVTCDCLSGYAMVEGSNHCKGKPFGR